MLHASRALKKLAFAKNCSIDVQSEQVLLSLNEAYVVLQSKMAVEVISLLKEGVEVEQVIDSLGIMYPLEELYFLLMRLEQDGFLVEVLPEKDASLSAFWSTLSYRSGEVFEALDKHAVSLRNIGFDRDLGFKEDLASMEVNVHAHSHSHSVHSLVLVSDYLAPELEQINEEARAENKTFLLAKPVGSSIWIGPVINPDSATCWACLKQRLELNMPVMAYKREQDETDSTRNESEDMPPALLQVARGLICLETVKWLASDSSFYLEDTLLSVDLRTMEIERHPCVHRPQCPVCGGGVNTKKTQLILPSDSTQLRREYTFRSVSKEKTLERYESLVSPITGVVRSLNRVESGNDDLTHNYTASHSGRLRGHSIESLRLATRDRSGGKGKTDIDAKVSGLCEALERYSAIYDSDPISLEDSYHSLGDSAIHPNNLLLFSESQFERRLTWNNGQAGKFQYVPEPFDASDEIAWTAVWSLSKNELRYIPTSYCYYGFDGPGSAYCKSDSNGLASGNTLEEAILYGFLELAERDAVSIWWYNRGGYPEVELSGFNDPYFESIKSYYRSINRHLWVLDITNDLQIPTFVAVSPLVDSDTEDILMGFGTHFDAKTAITRAILEVNQSLPAVLRSPMERRNQLLPDFADVLSWWESATIKQEAYLLPLEGATRKVQSDYDLIDSVHPSDILSSYLSTLEALDLEVLVLDMTRPDIGMPVARVMVPGLRHFWRRLAPGRLYEVPVKLGWRDTPTDEDVLNPISMFL